MTETHAVSSEFGRLTCRLTHRATRRAFLRRAAAVGLSGASLLLAACQQPTSPPKPSDATPIPPRPTPPPTTVSAQQAAASKAAVPVTPTVFPPKPGGSVVWATDADPPDLDPYGAASVAGAAVWADLTYQSLVMFDENMRIGPALAEAWVATTPTSWTFKLRQGVTFHDGTEFEAEDVRFWFERMNATETASPHRGWYRQVVKVEPQGRHEVVFTLSAPYAPLLATLASLRGSAITSRRWLGSSQTDTKLTAVGSGPFRIAEYAPGSHVTYVKNPTYWERGLPYLDEVTLRIVPDEEARFEGLRSGQLAAAPVGPAVARRLKADRSLTILSAAGATQQITVMNTRRKPFDDVRVRQAIALTVDRRAALDQVRSGEGRLTGPIPTGHSGWAIPPESLPYRRDPDRARQLLAEAGRPGGFEATIRTTAESPAMLAIARLLADQLREIGITLTIEELSSAALATAISRRDFEFCSSRIGFLPGADAYLSLHYRTNSSQNLPSWTNQTFDDLVDNARVVLDPGQRKALYNEAAGLLLDEAPAIWWYTENSIEALRAGLNGYVQTFSGRRTFLKTAWLTP